MFDDFFKTNDKMKKSLFFKVLSYIKLNEIIKKKS